MCFGIGSGSGRDAKIFSERGCSVLGIDLCSNLVKIAKDYAPLAEFKLADFETISFPNNSFDGVWSACSLLHIPKKNLPTVLKQIYSFLKIKGYLYLTLKKGFGEGLQEDTRYKGNPEKFCAYYQEEELQEILKSANFKILECTVTSKEKAYQTHECIRIFCQKQ